MAAPAIMKSSTKVVTKEDADKHVISYTPREFPFRVGEAAIEFVKYQTSQENPAFKIDRVVSATTGIAELEKLALSERVEAEALERLKVLQEDAYKQGYDLGRDEGQESAYREKTEEFAERIRELDQLMSSLEGLKGELVKQNEASLVMLVYQIANKLAMQEITEKRELVLSALQSGAIGAQDEESLTIKLAQVDFEFIESTKARLGKEFEFIKKAKLEPSPDVRPGGCVIVTNYGQVNATIEKRLEKVWASIEEKLPKTSDTLGEGHES